MLRLQYITGWLQRQRGNESATSAAPSQANEKALPWWVKENRPPLDELAHWPTQQLPPFVQQCAVTQRYLRLLGELDWRNFPEPPLRHWATRTPEPRAHFVAAFLVKLQEPKATMPDLHEFLTEHPALLWSLGFHLQADPSQPFGFDPLRSLPSHRHFSRVLRTLPNECLQFLLRSTVHLLRDALPADVNFGDEVSLDTKHILAWVKENNPKAFVKERFDKTKQPKGDPDCKLGCKKKNNERKATDDASATPTSEGLPASAALPPLEKGEYYWGYASGVVGTKVPGYGEFVLADFTQTFDKADASYFFPLMTQTEQNLGRKPKSGALDKAYDAFYVYEYFHHAGGFAAVPWADRADHKKTFSPDGLPLCEAGLPMPKKSTFWQKSHCLVPHEVGRHPCPLLFPEKTGETCPIAHKNWPKGGCLTTLPTSVGNRIRHQLDRNSDEYKRLFNQRTATERINSQAKELGIEQPKLRNRSSIANTNTLIYVLINLRALQRLKERPLKT